MSKTYFNMFKIYMRYGSLVKTIFALVSHRYTRNLCYRSYDDLIKVKKACVMCFKRYLFKKIKLSWSNRKQNGNSKYSGYITHNAF